MRKKLLIFIFLYLFFGAKSVFANNQLDVVINEIAWMGTTANHSDEWIELYNTTDNPILLDGWILEAEDGIPKTNLAGTINPKSYYLLERTDNNTISDITANLIYSNELENSGEKLILKSSSATIIDQIDASSGWFTGDNSTKNTMERINPLDLGDKPTNWTTNDGSKHNSIDANGNQINGTPKNQNSTYLTTPTPSLSSASTPSPTTTPTPQSTSSFTISDAPSPINSDQSFIININLSMPNSQNIDYYLKGAFKKADGTRYLGLTKKDSDWVEYGDDNEDQYKITTNASGGWTGNLEVKPDVYDKDYKGSGDYIFRVARLTARGYATWSDNETTIKIIDVSTAANSPSPNPTTQTSPSNSPFPKSSPIKKITVSPSPSSYDRPAYHSASIAGTSKSAVLSATASSPAEIKTANQKQMNSLVWLGSIFIFAGVGLIGYIHFRKNAKIHF